MNREIWANGDGTAAVVEGPERPPRRGFVRVCVAYSAVSWGTERHMVQSGFRGRLGYQACGTVDAVTDGLPEGWTEGMTVAVYGAPYVGHGDTLWVPHHLAAPLNGRAPFPAAAYAGLGAIALHGMRLGSLDVGTTAIVGGLGMLGQWLVRLLRLAGVRTVAVDPLPARRSLALAGGAEAVAADPAEPWIAQTARALGRPDGRFDAVFLCMGTDDLATLGRYLPRAAPASTLVCLGDVPVHAPREPLFQDEVRIVVSHAAGPGRGDAQYEADGLDYPLRYVRWTEGRNLRLAADLLARGAVDLTPLLGPPLRPQALARALSEGAPPETPGAVVTWRDEA